MRYRRAERRIKTLIIILFTGFTWNSHPSYSQKPSDRIDLYYTNLPLLEHLIKSDIDSIRRQHNLPFLYNDSICYLAARDHGQYLMDLEEIRHLQNDSLKQTPQRRVEYYGAKGFQAGENIAKIYLHTLFSYHVGVSQPIIMSVSTYKAAAAFIVNAWENSAEHYINILSKNYDVTGIAAIVNEDDKSLICVQVFAEVDSTYHFKAYPSLFPYDKFVPASELHPASFVPVHKDCSEKKTWNIEYPADEAELILFNELIGTSPAWYIIYDGKDVYLNMGEYGSAVRLFNNKYDGLALEIVPFHVYDCSGNSNSLSSTTEIKDCIFSGEVTKPIYLDRLFRKKLEPGKNDSRESDHFIPFAGRIPDNISEPYEVNVVFLKNNKIYKMIQSHHLCGEIPDHLIQIPLCINDTLSCRDYNYSVEYFIDTIDTRSLSFDVPEHLYNNLDSDTDSIAVTEYLKLFSLLKVVGQAKDDTGRLVTLIYLRMDSIQNYLFNRFLDNKINFSIIEALPSLFKDNEGYLQRIQPLARLYYDRIIFKYIHLKSALPDTAFQRINEMMRNFRNPLPIVQYNYYAMLIRNMNGNINPNISLANLREISSIIQRIEGRIPPAYLDSLRIFYHFQRVLKYYADGMFDYRRMYSSLGYIFNYYKEHSLSPGARVTLAKFYIHFRLYDFAYETILPAAGLHPYCKEAFILCLKLYYSGLVWIKNNNDYYDKILSASDILSAEEWLGLFEGPCRINFQLLDYETLGDLYCAKKRNLRLKNQDRATYGVSF